MIEQAPPEWLAEMGAPDYAGGFFRMGRLFALQHTHRTNDTLYVGFDDLGRSREQKRVRDGFGSKFAKEMGWSYLAVNIFFENWYRDPDLQAALTALAGEGFFAQYERVILTGVSMGGFAACAFAPLAPGCTVIALSPQSTLAQDRAAWEGRFSKGSAQDWTGPFSDAAEGIGSAGRAWIIYDPKHALDNRHASRIIGPNVRHLRTRYTAHGATQYLTQLGLLKEITTKCADDSMTCAHFYRLYRLGRESRRMLKHIMARTIKGGNPDRMEHLGRILIARGRSQLGRDMKLTAKRLRTEG